MFHRTGDDVVTFFFVGECHTFNRVIIGLRTAAGKHNFIRPDAKQFGHLRPRVFNRFFSSRTEQVAAGRIAKVFVNERQHRFRHPGIDGSCSVIIEINGVLHCAPPDSFGINFQVLFFPLSGFFVLISAKPEKCFFFWRTYFSFYIILSLTISDV